MEFKVQTKYLKIAPRKIRGIATAVKKLPLETALVKLEMLAKRGADPISAALKSAIANAQNKSQVEVGKLKIKNIFVDEGMRMKRRDKSHGARFGGGVIHKRTSHITVILEG